MWQQPEAREKLFGVIFKGFGPGPGTSTPDVVADLMPAPAAVRLGSRALNAASDQAELIREIVAVMQGKIGGVVRATAAPTAATSVATPGRLQPATRAAPSPAAATAEVISDWGKRCCAKDVAEIRAALRVIAASRARFQSAAVTNRLGRRPASTVDALVGQVNAALTAFENTRDARTAAAALANVARQSELLAGVLAGTR